MPIMLKEHELAAVMQDSDYRATLLRNADKAIRAANHSFDKILSDCEGDEVAAHLSSMLAKSRQSVLSQRYRFSLAIIVPMWREVRRMRPFSAVNLHGENCVLDKLEGLAWLFRDTAIDWHLFLVDDCCPEDSAGAAREILGSSILGQQATILRLADGFPYTGQPLGRLGNLEDSNKGGAVFLGCAAAAKAGFDYIGYTDCDNSVHIAQLGLLIPKLHDDPIVMGDRWAVNPFSAFHESRAKHLRSLQIALVLKDLLSLQTIFPDVVSPLKIFRREELSTILESVDRYDFCFDFDLAGAATRLDYTAGSEGILLFDSHAETSWNYFGQATIWHQKLEGMVAAARKYGLTHDERVAEVITRHLRSADELAFLFSEAPPFEAVADNASQEGERSSLFEQAVSYLERCARQ